MMKTQKITLTTMEIIKAIDSNEMTVDEVMKCVIRKWMMYSDCETLVRYWRNKWYQHEKRDELFYNLSETYGITLHWTETLSIIRALSDLDKEED